jgi:HSP20 family protein
MNALSRWDPFRELLDMRWTMDRLMQSSFQEQEGSQFTAGLSMNVSETEDAYEIEASLPGVNPDDIEITLNQNTLTIRGEVKEEEEKKDKTYYVRERRSGVFMRSIALPSTVNTEAIEAHHENGVLKLRLPKAEGSRPTRIQVQSGGKTKVLEGQARGNR